MSTLWKIFIEPSSILLESLNLQIQGLALCEISLATKQTREVPPFFNQFRVSEIIQQPYIFVFISVRSTNARATFLKVFFYFQRNGVSTFRCCRQYVPCLKLLVLESLNPFWHQVFTGVAGVRLFQYYVVLGIKTVQVLRIPLVISGFPSSKPNIQSFSRIFQEQSHWM